MITTEKKHWVNGHQVRRSYTKNLHFFTFRIGSIGVMILNFKPFFELYKLTK